MKEINIAKTIINKRKEKGITQDDLAMYIGVSKASVSKWETAQSYPDITFLPELASYFNISIDELMNYSPQMTGKDIKNLYHRLAKRFSKEPFDEVYAECKAVMKKYYSCFPLLMQMSILLFNHHMLVPERKEEVLEGVIDLCVRVKIESDDARICEQANGIHSTCLLIQGKPSEVIDLLDSVDGPVFAKADGSILASAYIATGNTKRAKELMQVEMYEKVMSLFSIAPVLISLNESNPKKADEIISRMFAISDLFAIDKLNSNSTLILCLSAAHSHILRSETEKSLEYLSRYTDICCAINYPLVLHGDEFFDSLDNWFESLDLGASAPRADNAIKESMLQAVSENPAFESLSQTVKYKKLIEKLKQNVVGR